MPGSTASTLLSRTVAPGTYVASGAVTARSSTLDLECRLVSSAGNDEQLLPSLGRATQARHGGGGAADLALAGVLRVGQGDRVALLCTNSSGAPVSLSFFEVLLTPVQAAQDI